MAPLPESSHRLNLFFPLIFIFCIFFLIGGVFMSLKSARKIGLKPMLTPVPSISKMEEPSPTPLPYMDTDLTTDLHHLTLAWLGDVPFTGVVDASESSFLKSPISGKKFIRKEPATGERTPFTAQKAHASSPPITGIDLFDRGSIFSAGWVHVGAYDADGPTGGITGFIREMGNKKQLALFRYDFQAVYWDPYKVTCPCFNQYTIFLSEPFDPSKYLRVDY